MTRSKPAATYWSRPQPVPGKTVVADFAIYLAQERNVKAFYTTPIKALSNQKYHDLVDVYGPDKVGLLTGDTSINSEADIVVMTTEVLRNMLYERSTTLNALRYVILDEVHYLADRFRGPVWEEVIIHLPKTVKIVGLSATVSNVEDFSNWIASVRGDTKLVISEHRPCLWNSTSSCRRTNTPSLRCWISIAATATASRPPSSTPNSSTGSTSWTARPHAGAARNAPISARASAEAAAAKAPRACPENGTPHPAPLGRGGRA